MAGTYHRLCRYFLIQPKIFKLSLILAFVLSLKTSQGLLKGSGIFLSWPWARLWAKLALCQNLVSGFWMMKSNGFHSPFFGSTKISSDWDCRKKIPTRSGKLWDFSSTVRATGSCRSPISLSSCRAPVKINSSSFWAGTKLFLLLLYLAPEFCWKCLSSSNAEFSSFPEMNWFRMRGPCRQLLQGLVSEEVLKGWWAVICWRREPRVTQHTIWPQILLFYFYASTVIKIPWQELFPKILHRLPGIPQDKYIWFPPEKWQNVRMGCTSMLGVFFREK